MTQNSHTDTVTGKILLSERKYHSVDLLVNSKHDFALAVNNKIKGILLLERRALQHTRKAGIVSRSLRIRRLHLSHRYINNQLIILVGRIHALDIIAELVACFLFLGSGNTLGLLLAQQLDRKSVV